MSCPVCGGVVPDSFGAVDKTYCSNACKQRAYRQRKKVQKEAKEQMKDLLLYSAVDAVIEKVQPAYRDQISTRIWSNLDEISDINTRLEVVNLIYRVIVTERGNA